MDGNDLLRTGDQGFLVLEEVEPPDPDSSRELQKQPMKNIGQIQTLRTMNNLYEEVTGERVPSGVGILRLSEYLEAGERYPPLQGQPGPNTPQGQPGFTLPPTHPAPGSPYQPPNAPVDPTHPGADGPIMRPPAPPSQYPQPQFAPPAPGQGEVEPQNVPQWAAQLVGTLVASPALWRWIKRQIGLRTGRPDEDMSPACLRLLAERLSEDQRTALTQFKCGLKAPVTDRKAVASAFLLLQIGSSSYVPGDEKKSCGC